MKIIIGSPDPSFSPIELETETNKYFEKEYYDINDETLPGNLYFHAIHIIRGRWPEAEPIIKKHPQWAYLYVKHAIKGRWLEAEPIIMQDPQYAYFYARFIIDGRWPEAELTIKKDKYWYKLYKDHIQ